MIRTLGRAAALAAAVLAGAPALAADSAPGLTIVEPYGAGSVTDRVIRLLEPELEHQTGYPVAVDHAGTEALARLAAAAPNGRTVIVVDLLAVEIAEAAGEDGVKLSALTPIAKLTGPGSVALVVGEASPIKDWAGFASAARAGTLKIALPGRVSTAGVPLALMEKALDVHFADIAAANRADILDALAGKRADAAFLVTATLLPGASGAAPPVRPIVTFGAARNPGLPQVPSFQESVGKPHNSITTAIAVFGPSGLDAVAIKRLTTAFDEAGRVAKAKPGAGRLAIEIGDAALLRETMQRDSRVIKDIVNLLH